MISGSIVDDCYVWLSVIRTGTACCMMKLIYRLVSSVVLFVGGKFLMRDMKFEMFSVSLWYSMSQSYGCRRNCHLCIRTLDFAFGLTQITTAYLRRIYFHIAPFQNLGVVVFIILSFTSGSSSTNFCTFVFLRWS